MQTRPRRRRGQTIIGTTFQECLNAGQAALKSFSCAYTALRVQPDHRIANGVLNFHLLSPFFWRWLGAESNRRHVDFQSTALPTELPSRDGADCVARRGVHYATM